METEFWLYKPSDLINTNNFSFLNDSTEQKKVKMLNLLAVFSIIFGLIYYKKTKNKMCILSIALVLSLTILMNKPVKSSFTPVSQEYDTGVYLVRAVNSQDKNLMNNRLYVNNATSFYSGDIIALTIGNNVQETNIVTDIQYTTQENTPVLILLNPLKFSYSKFSTKILKVRSSSPNIITEMDPRKSIMMSGPNITDPMSMAVQNFPTSTLSNPNRHDWNLELSTIVPGTQNMYEYQGQPYGNLKCRESNAENPMGTINVTEYNNKPTMYGTCNIQEGNNNNLMTYNQEAGVSQRIDDLLFHKGNSQSRFGPMPSDTLPNDSLAFGHWCYRNPGNLTNVKYASVFVNEPEKYKVVSALARASGSEGGGAGGR
jgi:hypothetical protein